MFVELLASWALTSTVAADSPLEWKGRRVDLESLPEELQGSPAQAISFWLSFAEEREYRIVASEDGECLFLWPEERRSSRKPATLIQKTIELVHGEFISEEGTRGTPATAAEDDDSARPAGHRPEDLFGPDWRGSTEAEPTKDDGPLPWGHVDIPLGTETAVLLQARKPDDYGAALDLLAEHFENLRGWTETAKQRAGVTTLRPLFGAVVENVAGNEEWNAENELVHRLTHLLIARHYGTQPVWLVCGIAWNVEMDLLRSVYCFPYRGEFVWATEHTGWDKRLMNFVKKRENPYTISDLTLLRRDHFHPDSALLAWGLVGYLRKFEPERLPALLSLMHDHYWEQGRRATSGHSWVIDANFEVDPQTQDRGLRLLAGDEVYDWSTAYFIKGKRWRKPKQ